jgi:colicin import membrane protein
MPRANDRLDFGPPRDGGAIRSLGLALLVHAALIAALTWGVNWKRSDRSVAFEAELWSNTRQEAAPELVEAPPPPPPPPPPEPATKVQEVTPPPPKVDIAQGQEKKRKQRVQQAQAEKELKLKKDQATPKAAQETKQAEAKNQQQQTLANAAALEAQRKQNIARALGLAGATGGETAKGTAQKSSGPSASYGGLVRAKVKPNIVFTEDIAGNPSAEVEVRTALDGTVMSQRLVKTSGNKAWDDAVVKAIIRTEKMPRDVDGRVPTPMILEFRPKD